MQLRLEALEALAKDRLVERLPLIGHHLGDLLPSQAFVDAQLEQGALGEGELRRQAIEAQRRTAQAGMNLRGDLGDLGRLQAPYPAPERLFLEVLGGVPGDADRPGAEGALPAPAP